METRVERTIRKHGTRYSYVMGCRCRECAGANRKYKKKWYERLKADAAKGRQK